ncbi:MAG TPA: amino acid ABC transporter permease [Pseudonocardiaceae bacterium]|nr:amino acid ABC transporter permease [Pseudonocardiaceae bacterium]
MTNALFDAPGPKARVRHGVYSVVAVLAVAAVLAFVGYRLDVTGQLDGNVWNWLQYPRIRQDLLAALGATLRAFAAGAVLALLFGAVFAAGRLSDHAVVRGVATFVVELFRAIPLLILIFFFYYGLPAAHVEMSPFTAVVAGLTLYNGSVLAEVFRAGILALPRGQGEAAYALGMRKTQTTRFVLLPQALRSMLPTIISQLVVLLKDTALGFLITYNELLYYARYLGAQPVLHRPLIPVTIVVAAMYIALNLLLSLLATYLERRNRRSSKHIGPPAVGLITVPSELG